MVRENRKAWKSSYFAKIDNLLGEYDRGFIVCVDNVGSKQMQQIRASLRGRAVIIMGKNTMMRKAIRQKLSARPMHECLLPHIVENVGLVLTKEDLKDIRDIILDNKVKAPARAGAIAPLDVVVPAQNTGMGPEKTSFFQALSINTKITRGTVEITTDVHLIKTNDKVGPSEATLLAMLGIFPFSYGLLILQVFDNGTTFDPKVLDLTQEDLLASFQKGVNNVAALSLALRIPTAASAPHIIVNGFKNLLAVAAATDVTFAEAEQLKEYLADPSKFAVAAPVASSAPAAADKPAAAEQKEESEEESDQDFGSMFD